MVYCSVGTCGWRSLECRAENNHVNDMIITQALNAQHITLPIYYKIKVPTSKIIIIQFTSFEVDGY